MTTPPPSAALVDAHRAGAEAATGLIEEAVSPNTCDAYAGALRRLSAWLDGRPLDDRSLAAPRRARSGPEGRQPAGLDDQRRSGEPTRVRGGCVLGGRARGAALRLPPRASWRPAFGLGVHRTAKADSVPVGCPARALRGQSGDRSRGRTPDGRSGPGAGRRSCPLGCELVVRA